MNRLFHCFNRRDRYCSWLTLRLCGFLFQLLPCCHYGLGLCLSSGLLFRLGLCAFRLIFFSLLLSCLQAVPLCNRLTNIICAQKDFFHVSRIGAVHLVQNGQSLIHLLNYLQNILLYGLHGHGCICVLRFENPLERKISFYVMDIVIIKFPYLRCLFFPLATLIIFHLGVNVVDGPLDNGHQFLLFLFKLLMPQFALGALLVGAASIGVVAPIFSIMVNADTALVLAGNLLSSLLLPLTLPMLLYIVDSFMTLSGFGPMNLPAHLSLSGMTLSLCVTIIVPFAGAFLTRKAPRVTEYILKHQFPVSVSTIALSTLAIFSNYSGVLHQSPSLVVKALGAACLLGAAMMVGGLFLPRSMPPQRKLAFLISYGTMNNVLMLIVSLEFFSASESIMAAMYLLPLNALLVYYRALSRSWGLEQAAG